MQHHICWEYSNLISNLSAFEASSANRDFLTTRKTFQTLLTFRRISLYAFSLFIYPRLFINIFYNTDNIQMCHSICAKPFSTICSLFFLLIMLCDIHHKSRVTNTILSLSETRRCSNSHSQHIISDK